MFSLFSKSQTDAGSLVSSRLFDENTFYGAFIRDLSRSVDEVIIESPFITGNRVDSLLPIFIRMKSRGVKFIVNTRHPAEHEPPFDTHARKAIEKLQSVDAHILFTGGHHRKLAIIDRRVLWEGSLNILSQNDSCEIMRRTGSKQLTQQMIGFTKIDRFLR